MNAATAVTITGGKFAGLIGVLDNAPRDGWARVLLVGSSWPVDVRVENLTARP